MNYKLSILICTLSNRTESLKTLLDELNYQIQSKPVQVLWIGDNKSMSVGEKRNKLLYLADGEYVSFIDDDDMISSTYIDSILDSLNGHKVVTFKVKKNLLRTGLQNPNFQPRSR